MSKKSKPQDNRQSMTEDDELQRRARALHSSLFPEEYDHMFDSFSDARERRRGINPMAAEHIDRMNKHRAALGFDPLPTGAQGPRPNTFCWVLEMLQVGKEGDLIALTTRRNMEDVARTLKQESERKKLQTPSWQNARIDEALAADVFSYNCYDKDDPDIIAFRILGALFDISPTERSEPPFHHQIRRILPGKSDAEYAELYRRALNEWMEAYGG